MERRSDADEDGLPILGAAMDLAIPDGAMFSLAVRPLSWFRAHAGAGSNSISPGVRIGAALIPWGVGPSLNLEAGHYFEGNANDLALTLGSSKSSSIAAFDRIGYDFINAHLGIEIGEQHATFFLHGGISYLRTQVHDADSLVGGSDSAQQTTTIEFGEDPVISGVIPSAKIGLIAYVL